MSCDNQPAPRELGAVIYLSSHRPLHVPDFLAEFHKNWPLGLLEKTGKELHRAFFRCGRTDFVLEMQHAPVRQATTDRVANSTLHWPLAKKSLAPHPAHILVTSDPADHVLAPACDLTKAMAALLPVTDSLAVCWLGGPALNSARTFAASAREMFSTGLYPLNLWVAARFDPATGMLRTQGMTQFDAPEIALAGQPDAAPLMIDYLFQIAQYMLTSHHQIKNGEKMDGPHGVMQIRIDASYDRGKSPLILEPAG